MAINRHIFRQADFIQVSIDNVVDALRDGALVVVVILLLFLMNVRATLITLLAIPLSLLVAVLTLRLFGATINTMTLGGIAIAIGALVDDAIINVENVFRRLRENALLPPTERKHPLTVTLRASLEIRTSITFATFIIMLVFVPLFFLSGVEGRLLAPLGDEQRPDLKAARLALETRAAELRLAQARRIPNIALGPLYRLDNEDQVVGGALVVPLPFFNRNQQEIATTLANLEVSRIELAARERTIRQEVAAAYARVQLTERRLAPYGKAYLDNLTQSVAFTQKAYEAGEITIFEFSVALDRLVQTRFRYLDAVLAYLQATVELDARLSFSCTDRAESETGGRGK